MGRPLLQGRLRKATPSAPLPRDVQRGRGESNRDVSDGDVSGGGDEAARVQLLQKWASTDGGDSQVRAAYVETTVREDDELY